MYVYCICAAKPYANDDYSASVYMQINITRCSVARSKCNQYAFVVERMEYQQNSKNHNTHTHTDTHI